MESGTTTGKKPDKRIRTANNLPQREINYQIKKLVSNGRDLTENVCLTSYPPHE